VIFPTKPTAPEPGSQAAITWSKVFPGAPEQVGKARSFLGAILEGRPAADDAALCLSELVSNACLHSRSGEPWRAVHSSGRAEHQRTAGRSPRRRGPVGMAG